MTNQGSPPFPRNCPGWHGCVSMPNLRVRSGDETTDTQPFEAHTHAHIPNPPLDIHRPLPPQVRLSAHVHIRLASPPSLPFPSLPPHIQLNTQKTKSNPIHPFSPESRPKHPPPPPRISALTSAPVCLTLSWFLPEYSSVVGRPRSHLHPEC